MSDPIISTLSLLIHVLFDSYIVILLLRLILQKLRADWFNPVSQFIIQLTEKPLKPLRKFIPGIRGFDGAIIVLALLLQLIEVMLLWFLQFGPFPNMIGSIIVALSEILSKVVYIYIYAIIINAIASWFSQLQSHPLSRIVNKIVNPVLSRIQRHIPLIAGIDISPIFALLLLTFINLLVVGSLLQWGTDLILR